jgi:hypothetical protein
MSTFEHSNESPTKTRENEQSDEWLHQLLHQLTPEMKRKLLDKWLAESLNHLSE